MYICPIPVSYHYLDGFTFQLPDGKWVDSDTGIDYLVSRLYRENDDVTDELFHDFMSSLYALLNNVKYIETYHVDESQINGNNGCATNSDDVDAVNFTPKFKLHGKYVGPSWTGGRFTGENSSSQTPIQFNHPTREQDFMVRPIDELDEAARIHDYQYWKNPGNKAAADKMLSEAAGRLVKPYGLTTKGLKAYAVEKGMNLMSKIGSRDDTQLSMPPKLPIVKKPPLKRELDPAVQKMFKNLKPAIAYKAIDPVIRPKFRNEKLNGNNGAATNSDDVKNQKQGVMMPSKAERAAQSARDKAASKKKAPPVRKSERKSPERKRKSVESGLTATQFQNTSDIVPYYHEGKTKNSKATMISLGTVQPNGIISNEMYANGSVNQSFLVDKTLFAGKDICKDIDNWEEMRVVWAKTHFIPSVDSTIPGSFWTYSDPDAADPLPPNATVPSSLLTSHKGAKKHTLWRDAVTATCNFNKAFVYTDSEATIKTNTQANYQPVGGDIRLSAVGVLNWLNGDNLSASSAPDSYGEWFLELEIQFRNSQSTDDSYFVFSAKSQAKNAGVLFTVPTGQLFDPFWVIYNSATSALNTECAFNPKYWNPNGQAISGSSTLFKSPFYLPVGTYMASVYLCQTSGSPPAIVDSTSVGTSISNAAFSIFSPSFADNVTLIPEFSGVVQTGGDPGSASSLHMVAIFTISQVTAGQSAIVQLLLAPTVTSGPAGFSICHAMMQRIPDFRGSPIKAFFPQAVANNQVGLDLAEVFITNGLAIDDEKYFEMKMACPRRMIKQTKDFLYQKWLETGQVVADIQVFPTPKHKEDWTNKRRMVEHLTSRFAKQIQFLEAKEPETPEFPEIKENPMTKSLHLNTSALSLLSSLVSKK